MAEIKYPVASLCFEVNWKDKNNTVNFSEVSGLTIESEPIEYRAGRDPLTPRKIPGLMKYSNVTLKRGIIQAENGFFEWVKTVQNGELQRRDVTISLLNELQDTAVMTWKMTNAWPVKVEGPSLNAKGNEIAIETLEFAHEGLTIE